MNTHQPADRPPEQLAEHSTTETNPSASATDRRALLAGIGGLAAGALLASSRTAHAGPLDPPPGPIAPTSLTLEELAARTSLPRGIAEPRRPLPDPVTNFNITQPGSYYLTRDTNPVGIRISASDVTLDLCGYTVKGGFSSGVIEVLTGSERVLIRNGRLDGRAFPSSQGVSCSVNAKITLEDLEIIGNAPGMPSGGVVLSSGSAVCRRVSITGFRGGFSIPTGVIEDCEVDSQGGINIFAGPGAVRRCVIRNSGSFTAVFLSANSSITDSQVVHTGTAPGIEVGDGSLVDQCVVSGGQPGIRAGNYSAVLRSVVRGARGVGMDVAGYSRVSDCNISGTAAVPGNDPGIGVRGSQRLRLERSTIAGNAAQGVYCTSFDAAIADCSIIVNSGVGIDCIGPAMIDRCHFANNNGAILVDALTRISQCHLDFNGPFGVQATSTGVGGTFVVDCDITRHTNGVDIRSTSGSGVFRSRFNGNTSANILAPAGNFQLIVFGPAAANTATNPNINIAL